VRSQIEKDKFIQQIGKPEIVITRELYSRIKEPFAEIGAIHLNFPIKVYIIDPTIIEYAEGNVEFSWSSSVNWFGEEGKQIREILWEMEII